MTSDYPAIRQDNERRYGTDIGRIGPMLLADRYDDRTHFIFELLQNAEDALRRRGDWKESRAVSFDLTRNSLRVSHFGQPFIEGDVRGICGIAESTKSRTEIGRFGIGFKSVYAITDRPEVHSGTEAFAIESFVWPVGVQGAPRHPEETLFVLPLKPDDPLALQDISRGLARLSAKALLFLRQIEEVRWKIEDGHSGTYLRDSKDVDSGVRRVTVIGQQVGVGDVDHEWLVFSRAVADEDGRHAGFVELAFSLAQKPPGGESIERVECSPLVVFFPTVVETHLGFLVQGPYRTTPSRDNVPQNDPWNQHLVAETGSLLVAALLWLRDKGFLATDALRCLPIDASKFSEASMFAPLFQATKEALSSKHLLPRSDGGYVSAARARLGRTQDLRHLFSASRLAVILEEDGEVSWLSGDISPDRAPELRRYLMQDLNVAEITPESIVPRLTKSFLEAQPDDWILALYEFLHGQTALRRRLDGMPLIRLEDGTHVPATDDGDPQAFLPGTIRTSFPTVRASVCKTNKALEFLRSLGLTQPDPVDDVIQNVLPRFSSKQGDLDDAQYEADLRRILAAFGTDSKARRDRLIAALRETPFVMAVDAGAGTKSLAKAAGVYVATERLRELFVRVEGVLLVNDTLACLRGEEIRDLLEVCGAVRYLRPIEEERRPSWQEEDWLNSLRTQTGHPATSGQNDRITDRSLFGLSRLLDALPQMGIAEAQAKAELLWEELTHLEERRGKVVFEGEYRWTHYGNFRAPFDAAFVRQLNETRWIPDAHGSLQRPEFILFDSLEWKENLFLKSKIRFKPPVIEALAREAGIEPGVLDLLKQYGITSVAELTAYLGLSVGSKPSKSELAPEAEEKLADLEDGERGAAPSDHDTGASETGTSRDRRGESGESGTTGGAGAGASGGKPGGEGSVQPERSTESNGGSRPGEGKRGSDGKPDTFISYIGVRPDDQEPDPEGLGQQARMALEEKAIEMILSREPGWQRTPTHNPGYDLYRADEGGNANQWCEVKAMTSCLDDHPVGLSRTQFDCARKHGEAYWLYVVEHVGTDLARIVRIQDPAGKARTFTFDRGWRCIASVEDISKARDA